MGFDSRPDGGRSRVEVFQRCGRVHAGMRSVGSGTKPDLDGCGAPPDEVLCSSWLAEADPERNGSEFIARAVGDWLAHASVGPLYIEPGAPWQNGYAESFHSRLWDELLNIEEFTSVREAKVLAKQWREDYNRRRPHSALGYQTPEAFRALWSALDGQDQTLIQTGT